MPSQAILVEKVLNQGGRVPAVAEPPLEARDLDWRPVTRRQHQWHCVTHRNGRRSADRGDSPRPKGG
jgi:hypothetical protein